MNADTVHARGGSPGPRSRLNEMPRRRLDESLGARRHTEFSAGVLEVKLDGALAQAENFPNLPKRLAARRPSECLHLTLAPTHLLRPHGAAGYARQPRGDQRGKHIVVNGLGEVIVGTQTPTLELVGVIAERR